MTNKAKKAHPNLLIIMPHQLVLGQAVFSSLLPIRSRPLPLAPRALSGPFPEPPCTPSPRPQEGRPSLHGVGGSERAPSATQQGVADRLSLGQIRSERIE